MKKFNYFVYALALTGAVFMTSCGDDDDDDSKETMKLVSAVVSIDGSYRDSTTFTYNTNGVLTKTEDYVINVTTKMTGSCEYEYKNDRLITGTYYDWEGSTKTPDGKDSISYDSNNRPEKLYDFNYSNGKFVLSKYTTTISYNSSNLPIKYTYNADENKALEYTDNNITKVLSYYENIVSTIVSYTYDTKKNPYKGNPNFMGEFSFYTTNNCLSMTGSEESQKYTYEYNSDGYPTKITKVVNRVDGSSFTDTIKVYYK